MRNAETDGKAFRRSGELMTVKSYLDRLVLAFADRHEPVQIPLLRKHKGKATFTATLREEGIEVSNLAKQPLLPWRVFEVAIQTMLDQGGRARKGMMQRVNLGDEKLPINSIEGAVAHQVYGLPLGKSGFRRITPIAGLLIWSGVCKDARGSLILAD